MYNLATEQDALIASVQNINLRKPIMKTLIAAILLSAFSLSAQAEVVRNDRENSRTDIARVVQVVNLVNKNHIMVNVAVEDLGGSTDVSPTQKVFLTLYSKGEMFSTDASFEIGRVWSFKSAKRVSGGIYEIKVEGFDENYSLVDITYVVDARKALTDLKNVSCDDFDCDASQQFQSSVIVTKK